MSQSVPGRLYLYFCHMMFASVTHCCYIQSLNETGTTLDIFVLWMGHLIAAFLRTAHPNKFKLDTAFPWVPSNTPAKFCLHTVFGFQDIWLYNVIIVCMAAILNFWIFPSCNSLKLFFSHSGHIWDTKSVEFVFVAISGRSSDIITGLLSNTPSVQVTVQCMRSVYKQVGIVYILILID